MPLPGGPADKSGNLYELMWTVYQFTLMLHGKSEKIRVEVPGTDKAEFMVTRLGLDELHQAKRSNQSGKWSLSSLASDDTKLLQTVYSTLSGNKNKFIFVSTSDAPELRELSERARQAESLEEFKSSFLAATTQNNNFNKLISQFQTTDYEKAFDILRRIEVRTIDETSLREQINWSLKALFLVNPDKILDKLRAIVEDSLHRIITRSDLINILEKNDFKIRHLSGLRAPIDLITEVTDRYLTPSKKKLIQNSLIPRKETQTILEAIDRVEPSSDFILIGKAGAGKTGCVIELIEGLRCRKIPVLAFRVDRLKPALTTVELGQQLRLEESPSLVLKAAADNGKAVLIIDQLDVVSSASGRIIDVFEVIDHLLDEVRGLRTCLKLHIVLVCREFDYRNDPCLRKMKTGEQAKVEITGLALDEVNKILTTAGFSAELLLPRQLELLRLPQNLALFLDAGFAIAGKPSFNTTKELFDRYWDEKRRLVNARATSHQDQWMDVIQALCEEMTRSQLLFVTREKLDRFASDYIFQMASEGVLAFDGQNYGFGHESFFDYCFARGFIARNQTLVEILKESEQHLFRRSQIRQVLSYLRDADRPRYCKELCELLKNDDIRIHIKGLAVAFLVDVPDPREDEWDILWSWLDIVVTVISSGGDNHNKLATMIWTHFFFSATWFNFIFRRGIIAEWLASQSESLINKTIEYLRVHQEHSIDIVAELLAPYVDYSGEWPKRFRFVSTLAKIGSSRRYFDLFLRLIHNGTLDTESSKLAGHNTFLQVCYKLAKDKANWLSEAIATWLQRRVATITQPPARVDNDKPNWSDLFKLDEPGAKLFHEAAQKSPDTFIQYVFPVVLEIIDKAVLDNDTSLPKRDAVWSIMLKNEYESDRDACISALVIALQAIASTVLKEHYDVVKELKQRDTYTANFLLLNLYTAGATHFADEAINLLCDQTWRFKCGYAGSPYWIATELISKIIPRCSPENLHKLEETILNYSPDDERTATRHRYSGQACFSLLSVFPQEHLSVKAKDRYKELERKFKEPYAPPKGIVGFIVKSPIEEPSAKLMSDQQWLNAIEKYGSKESSVSFKNLEKGGALQLAQMLRELVKREPDRFAKLCLKFPIDTNPIFTEMTLDGLTNTNISLDLKLAICDKVYSESSIENGKTIAILLGSIKDTLPDKSIEMLDWLATKHPNPENELWINTDSSGNPMYGGDIFTYGLNTTRGRAAMTIHDLIHTDEKYVERFRSTLKLLVKDKSTAVHSCVIQALLAVARHNMPLALELFQKIDVAYEPLLATQSVYNLIYCGLRQYFPLLRSYIERMLRSAEPEVSKAGSMLACLASFYHKDAACLAEKAMSGEISVRLGVAIVASSNISHAECMEWCQEQLLKLFNDDDSEVRRISASCFRRLGDVTLEPYEKLILAFCDSLSFKDDSSPILETLVESTHHLPGITYSVCQKYFDKFNSLAEDQNGMNTDLLVKLIFRTYHHHQHDEWTSKCLNLIDLICLEGSYEAITVLDEYER